MAKEQLQIEGTDTPTSKLCDKFLEQRDKVETVRKSFQAIEKELIEHMRSSHKKTIKHGGVTIRLSHMEEKDKIQIISQ